MTSKCIYLCQDFVIEDLNVSGLGCIYLAGPRNKDGTSWRFDLIKKIEDLGLKVPFLIPEPSKNSQLANCPDVSNIITASKCFKWQHSAMAMATAIAFWFPKDATPSPDSFVQFGMWCKSERVFLGIEDTNYNYMDWLFHSEQKMTTSPTLDQLAERIVHWIMG